MAKTVVGLFDQFSIAQQAIRELTNSGFSPDDISLIANDTTGEYSKSLASTEQMSGTAAGAGTGAVIGGIGGLLVGLGALAIPGIGPVIAAGPLATTLLGVGVGAAAGGMIGALIDLGVPEEEAGYYAEGVRRGGTLVSVRAEDEMLVDRAVNILERHGAVDVHQRAAGWRRSGWTGYNAQAGPYDATQSRQRTESISSPRTEKQPTRTQSSPSPDAMGATAKTSWQTRAAAPSSARTSEQGKTIPVVEEELQVGKRAVERGGVRVYSHVVEKPVEEHVRLRDEKVSVERRPVNRAVSDTDAAAFKEEVVEVHETGEEAVVAKRARVVEEVAVRKDVTERTETVRDKARRTEVEVEPVGGAYRTGPTNYENYAADFRGNFATAYGNRGYTYERYEPAYRFGYALANDKRHAGKDWAAIEADARSNWEKTNKGAWEDFKDSIRYAWDRVRGYTPAEAKARTAERDTSVSGFDTYADDFRKNFTSCYADRGYTLDRYEPAYRYGYTLANDQRYSGWDWPAVETEARRGWEKTNKGAWEDFKDSIRYAWDRVRGRTTNRAA